jgi:hypothetical protein
MDAGDLRPEQARAVIDGTGPILDCQTKLVARMDALAWMSSDSAYLASVGARDALQDLFAGLEHPQPPERPRWARGDGDGA